MVFAAAVMVLAAAVMVFTVAVTVFAAVAVTVRCVRICFFGCMDIFIFRVVSHCLHTFRFLNKFRACSNSILHFAVLCNYINIYRSVPVYYFLLIKKAGRGIICRTDFIHFLIGFLR